MESKLYSSSLAIYIYIYILIGNIYMCTTFGVVAECRIVYERP